MDANSAAATVQLVGNSPTATDALSALGGDLTLSISWAIANELLDAAHEAELGEAELIGIVLSVSIVLSALPNVLLLMHTELVSAWAIVHGRTPAKPSRAAPSPSGLLSFVALFVSVAQRLSTTIAVQLIASNVRVQQPLRTVRIITLAGVAVFFVFLQRFAGTGRGR